MVDVCVGPAESSYLRFDPPGAQLLPIGSCYQLIHLTLILYNVVELMIQVKRWILSCICLKL